MLSSFIQTDILRLVSQKLPVSTRKLNRVIIWQAIDSVADRPVLGKAQRRC